MWSRGARRQRETACEIVAGRNSATVTLEVRDEQGFAAVDRVSLGVDETEAPLAVILAPLPPGPWYADQPVVVTGEVSDAEDAPEELQARWFTNLTEDTPVDTPPDSAGQVTGSMSLVAGSSVVVLEVEDLSGKVGRASTPVEVRMTNTAPTCAVLSPADDVVVALDELTILEGLVVDPDVPHDRMTVSWTSSIDGVLATGAPGADDRFVTQTDALSAGDHRLVLEAADEQGVSCTAEVSIRVGEAPTIVWTAPDDGAEVRTGAATLLQVEVADAEDPAEALTVRWTSDLDGDLGEVTPDSAGAADLFASLSSPGAHLLTATVEDTDGLSASAVWHVSGNQGPDAPEVQLLPVDPVTGDGLEVVLGPLTDAEGDAVTTTFAWFRNGLEQVGLTDPTVPDGLTVRDELWRVVVTASDPTGPGGQGEAEVTIGNAPPAVGMVDLLPTNASPSDMLRCEPSGLSDPENDPVGVTFRWEVDGQPAASTNSTLEAPAFAAGSSVQCFVTPQDLQVSGPTVASPLRTIGDPPPTAPVVRIEPDPAVTTDTLVVVVDADAVDPDGGAITYRYAWSNGVGGTASTVQVDPSLTARDEVWQVLVFPSDGTSEGPPGEAVVRIVNSPPSVEAPLLIPGDPTTSDDLTCQAGMPDDPDGDVVSMSYQWYVNGTPLSVPGSVLSSTLVVAGDLVWCETLPSDGELSGAAESSNVVLIGNSAPTVTEVLLGPDPATASNTLSCIANGLADDDGDGITLTRVDDQRHPRRRPGGHLAAGPGPFVRGDEVVCWVTPFDGQDEGAVVLSNTVVIDNARPRCRWCTSSPIRGHHRHLGGGGGCGGGGPRRRGGHLPLRMAQRRGWLGKHAAAGPLPDRAGRALAGRGLPHGRDG